MFVNCFKEKKIDIAFDLIELKKMKYSIHCERYSASIKWAP